MSEQKQQTSIYPVKTTGGQERTVATFVANRAIQKKKPIYSILALDTWKGYVLFEAPNSQVVDESIQGFKHVRSKIPGMMQYSDIEKFLVTKSMIAEMNEGDTVEIVAGPFKSMRAKITRVEQAKQELTVILLDTPYQMPVTISASYLKIVERAKPEQKA
ncbi:MAG: transcription elongation factor Spt5 [Thaumarchaeota archaeon]|nr:transcription elongation factor Spt5 [Nitrososphaerota archaeon]MCS4539995.1 transcription elongation factor Spt5 [Nitrososphaerota archaeon]